MKAESWLNSESLQGRRWNHFPNSTIARYGQLTQTIELPTIDSEFFFRSMQSMDPVELRKVWPLFYHELRHWIDHVSTVWGQGNLISAYSALEAREVQDIERLWKVVDYYRKASRDRFESYYTTVERTDPPDGHSRVWTWSLSSGVCFDSDGRLDEARPIVFTRFDWPDGSRACRVPFSVAALLEVSSMYFEWERDLMLVDQMGVSARSVQRAAFAEKVKDYLFDPNLAVYSVGVHLVANRLTVNDPILAFKLASALAHVSLNLVEDSFDSLRLPSSFLTWGERNKSMAKLQDRGFAFLVLAHHAPKADDQTDVARWLDATMQEAGLDSLSAVYDRAARWRAQVEVPEIREPFKSELGQLLARGNALAGHLKGFPTPESAESALGALGLPPILFGDFVAVDPLLGSNGDANACLAWLEGRTDLIWRLSEFVDACGL